MSWNPKQQLNCQNCHSLRINAEALCKLVGVVESLQSVINSIQPVINSIQPVINSIQPVINSIQPIIDDIQRSSSNPDPAFMDSGDGIQSDTNDNDDVEDGAKEDSLSYSGDGSKSTTRSCPHPNCAQKTHIYAQESSLIRHFSNHIECNEACLFCGRLERTIYKYLAHFGSCDKKENSSILTTALKRKSELSKRSRDELRRMSKESVRSSKIDVDMGDSGGKRKAGDTGLPSQRRRVDPPPDSGASLGAVTAESPYPFGGIPPWNGYEDPSPFRNSQLPNDFAANVEPFRRWYPRATLLADYTVDWNDNDETGDQYATNASEQIPILFNSTDHFAEVVAVNEGCVNRTPMKDCDTGLIRSC
ncbi:hypothetical protein K469DRAFT_698567 [Zopfia rhizophila CBS 207.26]|uniref:Uncharacterized protein n=1 Tax=Zopfia rhizophila CBS 207.26 TaxID=1314779 RepID=A0A6A6EUW6_9PEZI|nr:hypothetical protein K469DRAFT_698567 [Zopfia rhizophila CBS 207.26]